MGCGCSGSSTSTASKYEFTTPDGKTKVYSTQVEAEAAKIRAGGGEVKPAR